MSERLEYLVQAYAFGRLTPGEMQELTAAALDDDAVFAAMASADSQRRFLADSSTRAAVLRGVEPARGQTGWLLAQFATLWRPLPVAAACAALLAAVFYFRREVPGPDQIPAGLTESASETARVVFRIPMVEGAGVSIEPAQWMGGTVPEGDPLRLEVRLDAPGAVFAAQLLPDGKARWVIPARLSEDGDRPRGLAAFAFDASPPGQSPGELVLRVLVTDPGADPRLPNFARAPRLVREIRYRVEARR